MSGKSPISLETTREGGRRAADIQKAGSLQLARVALDGCRDFDITEIDITESDVTETDITENDITESDITESDIT